MKAAHSVKRVVTTWFIALGVLAAVASSPASAAEVKKDERVLLVILDLQTYAVAEYRWMYEWIEAFVVAQTPRLAGGAYREIRLLGGPQATVAQYESTLDLLNQDKSVKAIDTVIELHGSPGALSFREGATDASKIADRISKRADGKLRALHSGACYGKTHAPEFIRAGYQAVAGARAVNSNGLYDLPTFLTSWVGGATFETAQTRGNNPTWIRLFDAIGEQFGFTDLDSYKERFGDKTVTIGDPTPTTNRVNWTVLLRSWKQARGKSLGFSLDRIATTTNVPGGTILTNDTYKRGLADGGSPLFEGVLAK